MLPIAASTPGASPLSQPRASGGESYGATPNGTRNQEPKSNLAAPAPAGAGASSIANADKSPAPGQPGLAEVVQAKIASSEAQAKSEPNIDPAFEEPTLLKGKGVKEMAEGNDQPPGSGIDPNPEGLTRGGPAGVETTNSAVAPESAQTPESGENEDVTQAAREGYAGGVVATADPVEPGLVRAA